MSSNKKIIEEEVVVGILLNKNGQILIAKRRNNQFMPGYWELPGGKIKVGENKKDSLKRELFEELGVTISKCKLKHTMFHQYPDKFVKLWIYNVEKYSKEPSGKEGQDICWCSLDQLYKYELLPTMREIVHKISLPKHYWITPDDHDSESVIEKCHEHLMAGTKIIQLRSKVPLDHSYIDKVYRLCQNYQTSLILNTPNKTYQEICDGWHLTSNELLSLNKRPCDNNKLLGVSTHNALEAEHAENISADYISLSPVNPTPSHSHIPPLGWQTAADIISNSNLPVYLLGGMSEETLDKALSIGAQGVAGISQI